MLQRRTIPEKIFEILCRLPAIGSNLNEWFISEKKYPIKLTIQEIIFQQPAVLWSFNCQEGQVYGGYIKDKRREHIFFVQDAIPEVTYPLENDLGATIIPDIIISFESDSKKFKSTPELGILRCPALKRVVWTIVGVIKALDVSSEDKKNLFEKEVQRLKLLDEVQCKEVADFPVSENNFFEKIFENKPKRSVSEDKNVYWADKVLEKGLLIFLKILWPFRVGYQVLNQLCLRIENSPFYTKYVIVSQKPKKTGFKGEKLSQKKSKLSEFMNQ